MCVSPSRLVLESARQNGATSIKRCLSSLFPLLRYLLQVTQEGRVCSGSAVKVPTTSAGAGGIWSCRTRKQDTDRNECCSSACSLLFVHLETPNLSPSGKPSGNAVPDTSRGFLAFLSVPRSSQGDSLHLPHQVTPARTVRGARGSLGVHPKGGVGKQKGPVTKKSLEATMASHQVSRKHREKP